MSCINCAEWNGGIVCIGQCASKVTKQRFYLLYRLNAECAWQQAYVEGINIEDATANLLVSLKTIYKMGSKNIEITKTIS